MIVIVRNRCGCRDVVAIGYSVEVKVRMILRGDKTDTDKDEI